MASCEFEENLNILRQIDFFSTLPLELNKILAYLCTREKYKQGDYLFRENDTDEQAYYIIAGTTKLFYDEAGKERMIRDYETGAFLAGSHYWGIDPVCFR